MKARRGIRKAVTLCLLVFSSQGLSEQNSHAWEAPGKERVVGKLVRVFAVGGETTGWAVQLEAEEKISGTTLKQIDVDPAPAKIKLESLRNKRVEVTGTLIWRHGVERGERPVIVIETIRALENGKLPSNPP